MVVAPHVGPQLSPALRAPCCVALPLQQRPPSSQGCVYDYFGETGAQLLGAPSQESLGENPSNFHQATSGWGHLCRQFHPQQSHSSQRALLHRPGGGTGGTGPSGGANARTLCNKMSSLRAPSRRCHSSWRSTSVGSGDASPFATTSTQSAYTHTRGSRGSRASRYESRVSRSCIKLSARSVRLVPLMPR
jgi:hypothetical protein